MPPKKAKIIIKKKDKKKDNKKKLQKIDEFSLKSTDNDSNEDDYESEDITEDITEEIVESDSEEIEETVSAITVVEPPETEEIDELDEEPDEEEIETESEASEEAEVEVEAEAEAEVEADDECLYRKAKVKNLDKDDDNEELEEVYDDDNLNFNEIVKPDERITKPFMTIFERVRLLGDRAKQLSLGAKPMIKGLETMNPKEIAKLELEKGVLPLIIERTLPNGRKERWYVNELQIIN